MSKLNEYLNHLHPVIEAEEVKKKVTAKQVIEEIKKIISAVVNPDKALHEIAQIVNPRLTKTDPTIMSMLTGKKENRE